MPICNILLFHRLKRLVASVRNALGYYMAGKHWIRNGNEVIDQRSGLGTDRTPFGGKATQLNGVDQFCFFEDESFGDFDTNESFTFSIWFKTSSAAGGNDNGIVYKKATGQTVNAGYSFLANAAATYFRIADGTNTVVATGPLLNDGQWHHAICERDAVAQTIKLYIDGALVDNRSTSGLTGSTRSLDTVNLALGALSIADGLANYHEYDGLLWQFRLADQVLTGEQKEKLYTDPLDDQRDVPWLAFCPLEVHDLATEENIGTGADGVAIGYDATSEYSGADVPGSRLDTIGFSTTWSGGQAKIADVDGTDNSISFKIRTTEDTAILFSGESFGGSYLFYWSIGHNGSPTFRTGTCYIDGVLFDGTTGDLHSLIADGSEHSVVLTGVSFQGPNFETEGLWWNSYTPGGGFDTGDTAVWDLVLNGVVIPGPQKISAAPNGQTDYKNGDPLQYKGVAPNHAKLVGAHCLALNGVDQYGQIANPISLPGDFTVGAFVDFRAVSGSSSVPLPIFASNDTANVFGTTFEHPTDDQCRLKIGDAWVSFNVVEVPNLNELAWVVLRRTGNLLELLLGDQLSGSTTNPTETFTVQRFGRYGSTHSEQVLTCAFIAGSAVPDNDLAAIRKFELPQSVDHFWSFSQGSGPTVHDVVGSEHLVVSGYDSGVWSQTQDEYHRNLLQGFNLIGGVKIPAASPTHDVLGGTLSNRPIDGKHNGAESGISWGHLSNVAGVSNLSTHNFGDTQPGLSVGHKTETSEGKYKVEV